MKNLLCMMALLPLSALASEKAHVQAETVLTDNELASLKDEATRLYRNAGEAKGDEKITLYVNSAKKYAQLAGQSENGYTYYNLGNALYRAGQKSKALAAWLHAKELLPRFDAIGQNIEFVRDELRGGRSGINSKPHPAARAFFFWHYGLSGAEVDFACVIFAWLLAIVLFWRKLFPVHAVVGGKLALGIGVLLAAFLLSAITRTAFKERRAVVVSSSLGLRSAPGARAVELSKLFEGAELRVLEREQNWSRVEIDSNHRGWVDGKSILELQSIPQSILGKTTQ